MTGILLWIILGVAIVLGASATHDTRTETSAVKAITKLSERFGLAVPRHLEPALLHRDDVRKETGAKYGWIGLTVGAVAALGAIALHHPNLGAGLVLLPTALGLLLGQAVGSDRGPVGFRDDATRVARPTATEVMDYTTLSERRAAWLAVAAVGVGAVTLAVVWALTPVRPGVLGLVVPVVLAALVAAGLVVLLRARDRIVERPQHAKGDLELAWDDAWRSSTMRQLQDLVVLVGLLSNAVLLITAGSWVIEPDVRVADMDRTFTLGMVALAVGVVSWAAVLVPWLGGRSIPNPSASLWEGRNLGRR